MSIPYIHITALYLLWFYFLLCLGGKLALDHYRKKKKEEYSAAVADFFRSGVGALQSPEFQTVRRLCRQPELFRLACTCYQENTARCPGLTACLVQLFHDQLDSGLQKKYPLFRCMLLERMALCQIRSPRLDRFLEGCRNGSELEQLWCTRCTPVSTGGIQ